MGRHYHYPFAHRGNIPFSTYLPGGVQPSTILYHIWGFNAPDVNGFWKFEVQPGNVNAFLDPNYPALPIDLPGQLSKSPLHPGNVRYQFIDQTLPSTGWEIAATNRQTSCRGTIDPNNTLREKRRNTVFTMNVNVSVGVGFTFADTRDFPVIHFISGSATRAYNRVVTEPTPPTYLRRNHPAYKDYTYTLTSADWTLNTMPGGSSGGVIPPAIQARHDEVIADILAAFTTWEPVVTFRLFAMPYGVSEVHRYYLSVSEPNRRKVELGGLF